MAEASAPGKAILLGEHAVVFGEHPAARRDLGLRPSGTSPSAESIERRAAQRSEEHLYAALGA